MKIMAIIGICLGSLAVLFVGNQAGGIGLFLIAFSVVVLVVRRNK